VIAGSIVGVGGVVAVGSTVGSSVAVGVTLAWRTGMSFAAAVGGMVSSVAAGSGAASAVVQAVSRRRSKRANRRPVLANMDILRFLGYDQATLHVYHKSLERAKVDDHVCDQSRR
jgi:hypothetical protein